MTSGLNSLRVPDMANILQGFYSMPALANNASGQIAKFGELSTTTRTFTKDEKNFADPLYPNVELVTFQTYDEFKVSINPGTTFKATVLSLGNWLYNQHVGGNIPAPARLQDFLNSIAVEFPALQNTKIGAIQTTTDGSRNFINWISFTLMDNQKAWDCKIWISNDEMYSQYEGGEILVLPPLEPVDGLQGAKAAVVNLLKNVVPGTIIEKMNSLQGRYRATSTRKVELVWHDKNDPASTIVTEWYVIVYGNLINDLDLIKNTIRDYLAQNSAFENWNIIYPELFSSNEFVYIPLYEDVAFPNSPIVDGRGRSVVRTGNLASIAQLRIPNGYAQTANLAAFMTNHLQVMSHTYRTLMLLALANPANANSVYKMTDLYPDYCAIPSTEVDFDRMADNTKEFVRQLQYALDIAYSFGENDVAPDGFSKVKRGIRTYIGFQLQGYYHLVLIRANY